MVEVFLGKRIQWVDQKQKKMAEKNRSMEKRQAMARELEWIQMGKKARKHRNKARIKTMSNCSRGLKAISNNEENGDRNPKWSRMGDIVVRARGLFKGYGEKLLYRWFGFRYATWWYRGNHRCQRCRKNNPFSNGSMVRKHRHKEELKVGEDRSLSYVSQHRDDLDDNKTVWENISGGHEPMYVGKQEMNSRAYVSAFWFS